MITAKVWAAKITTIQSNVHPIVAHGPQRRGDDAELFGTDGTRSTSPSRGGRASGRSGSTGLIGDWLIGIESGLKKDNAYMIPLG
jgi:hypothetical protein